MEEEPELYIFRPPDRGDQWRADASVSVRRAGGDTSSASCPCSPWPTPAPTTRARAEAVLDGLFVARHRETDEPCTCSCHPQLPETDQHDYGSACPCRLTAAERRAGWDAWAAERDAYWASPGGREIQARSSPTKTLWPPGLRRTPG